MSYITDLAVSKSLKDENDFRKAGFTVHPGNLNAGSTGYPIHLWYKRGTGPAITRIQFSFTNKMRNGLIDAKYQELQINAEISLWYLRGTTKIYEVNIVDLYVTTQGDDEPDMFRLGWERLACNMIRKAGGKLIHLWVKREKPTYICDITANADCEADAELFNEGYIRMDENTNRPTKDDLVFIWYRQTTDTKAAIQGLKVSLTEVPGYEKVDQNLLHETPASPTFLWYKKGPSSGPINAISVLLDKATVQAYQKSIPVVPILNTTTDYVFVCYHAELP